MCAILGCAAQVCLLAAVLCGSPATVCPGHRTAKDDANEVERTHPPLDGSQVHAHNKTDRTQRSPQIQRIESTHNPYQKPTSSRHPKWTNSRWRPTQDSSEQTYLSCTPQDSAHHRYQPPLCPLTIAYNKHHRC